jgi:hypothetical protein
MSLAQHQRSAKRTIVKIARGDVIDLAAVGSMWFLRVHGRLYVTHVSWYPELTAPDATTIRGLYDAGWTRAELARRYDSSDATIERLLEGDPRASASSPSAKGGN